MGNMDRQAELRIIRAAYSKQILAAARVDNARIAHAFATVAARILSDPVHG